jgi:hypothetical protein
MTAAVLERPISYDQISQVINIPKSYQNQEFRIIPIPKSSNFNKSTFWSKLPKIKTQSSSQDVLSQLREDRF